MDPLLALALAGIVAVFAFAGFAQIKALYHFTRYMGAMTPKQRWSLSFLGPFALACNKGLSEDVLRHRSLFFKWELIFLLVVGLMAVADFGFKYQTGQPLFSAPSDAKR